LRRMQDDAGPCRTDSRKTPAGDGQRFGGLVLTVYVLSTQKSLIVRLSVAQPLHTLTQASTT